MIFPANPGRAHRETRTQGYVSFRLLDQWLGVPVVLAQEVLSRQRISPVPLAPVEVAGFLNLRGQIVTAIDLRMRMALPARDVGEEAMSIVVRDGDELFSLQVDEVGDVVEVEEARVEAVPPTLDPRWVACCEGVIRRDPGLLLVLDVRALLASADEPVG